MDYSSMDFPDRIKELKVLVDKYPRLLDEEWEQLRVLANNVSVDISDYQYDLRRIKEIEKAERQEDY